MNYAPSQHQLLRQVETNPIAALYLSAYRLGTFTLDELSAHSGLDAGYLLSYALGRDFVRVTDDGEPASSSVWALSDTAAAKARDWLAQLDNLEEHYTSDIASPIDCAEEIIEVLERGVLSSDKIEAAVKQALIYWESANAELEDDPTSRTYAHIKRVLEVGHRLQAILARSCQSLNDAA